MLMLPPQNSYLLATIDDIFGEVQATGRRSPDHRMMAGRRMRHLHRTELQEGLAQRDATQQQLSRPNPKRKTSIITAQWLRQNPLLPRTAVARFVLVRRTTDSATDAVHVLVALRAVLRKVDARPEHAANVGVPLVEALLHDRIDERTAVEEHALARLQAVLLGDFGAPMRVAIPQLTVLDLLDL